MVTREDGRDGTTGLLREWVENKDRNLRDGGGGGDEFASTSVEGKVSSTGALNTLKWEQLHVNQSIDHALNTLKAHSHCNTPLHTLADLRRQPTPLPEPSQLPLSKHTFCTVAHLTALTLLLHPHGRATTLTLKFVWPIRLWDCDHTQCRLAGY